MTEDQEDYIHRAAKLLNRLDPTRLRTIVIFGWPLAPPSDVYHELDALGINSYFGWYAGPERLDREPPAPRPVPRPDARVLPGAGAVRDRVRRRVEPQRARRPEGHVRVPARPPALPREDLHLEALPERRAHLGAAGLPLPPRLERRQPDAAAAVEPEGPRWTTRWHKKPAFATIAKLYKSVRPVARRPYFAARAGRPARRATRRRRGRARPRRSVERLGTLHVELPAAARAARARAARRARCPRTGRRRRRSRAGCRRSGGAGCSRP